MKNDKINKISEAFDSFILDIGGNVDPRGGCNRTRKALMKFWKKIELLNDDVYASVDIERRMKKIINNRIVSDKFKSQPKVSVYDYLLTKIE